jgi:hypothetical protein
MTPEQRKLAALPDVILEAAEASLRRSIPRDQARLAAIKRERNHRRRKARKETP